MVGRRYAISGYLDSSFLVLRVWGEGWNQKALIDHGWGREVVWASTIEHRLATGQLVGVTLA